MSDDFRPIGDPSATRKSIFDSVRESLSSLEPLKNNRHVLRLVDVDYEDPEEISKEQEREAVIRKQTLARRLRGTWRLETPDGQVLDQRRTTLARVPYLTPRGTFILRGTNYSLAHQSRLRPGIFTRIKESGEVESHVNVAKGYGHRYLLDPKTGVFKLRWGQANLPLYPVLRALGAKESDIRRAWGDKIYQANAAKSDATVLKKLHARLHADRSISPEEAVRQEFARMELDPEVVRRTLGQPFSRVDAQAILAATQKLLKVHRGETDPDDRDHLAYQRLLGPEDILAENVRKSVQDARRAFWRASMKGHLRNFPTAVFDTGVDRAFYATGLGSPIEEVNPLEVLDQSYRVTRMGSGGIPSSDSVPLESRQLHPSQMSYLDPVVTPESGNLGVDIRLAANVRKGKDGRIYSRLRDVRTGKESWYSPDQIADATIAFPGEMSSPKRYARVIQRGRLTMVPKSQVDLEAPVFAFSPLANLIPFKSQSFGQRIAMGARMLAQALPLTNREAPLVQMQNPFTGKAYAQEYGTRAGAVRAPVSGVVKSVEEGVMTILDREGKEHRVDLYRNLPTNRKTFWHNEPVVEPGTPVKAGQLLAYSNFTDKSGVLAPGLNARIAFLPAKGYNYEDAIVISKSFAERLRSEHMYQSTLDLGDENLKLGRHRFQAIFPSTYKKEVLDRFDDSGLIKPGTKVEYGDPLILAVRERQTGPKLGRSRRSFADASVKWTHHSPGVVVDAYRDKSGVNVVVKSTAPAEVGDKLSGLHGNKGVISAIWDDSQMPQDSQGRPVEILMNDLGVISRGNPAQVYEAALGKLARKLGHPIVVPDFATQEELHDWVTEKLAENGLSLEETLTDPDSGAKLKDIATGELYILKLHHLAESKAQGRDLGGGYSAEGMPIKTERAPGGKRIGMMEVNALLSHGAYGVLDDARRIRGQANPDYWRQVMQGYGPPPPKEPFVYRKYLEQLRAVGINPTRSGNRLNIMALTSKDIDALTGNREITDSSTVAFTGGKLRPVPGGLFSEKATGGLAGTAWSFIRLPEPIPSPVMEEPLRRILGLTQQQFRRVLSGQDEYRGVRGPKGLYNYVKNLNLDKEIAFAQALVRSGRKTKRDEGLRRLRYLQAAKRLGQHPSDWFWTKVPVLPPQYRPISMLPGKGTLLVPDVNYLYKEVLDAKSAYESLQGKVEDLSTERLAIYDAVKAVTGLGEPTQLQHRQQKVRGVLKTILGSSPKRSVVQRKLLTAKTDLSGRAVISPDPRLGLDEIGLPERIAWDIYKPFIVRRLVRSGVSTVKALEKVKDKTDDARKALLQEMEVRPVIWNRAPTLHRFGIMAAKPKLVKGDTLLTPPLVVPPMGGDFDGDAVQLHVPASDDAVKDALTKMLPSKNLINPAEFKATYKPGQEYVGGLWYATKEPDRKKRKRVFRTRQDAVAAFRRGEISADQPIEILES